MAQKEKTVNRIVNEARQKRRIAAEHYDSGETTLENFKHWAASASDMSVYTANNSGVRRKLRQRSRYEADNNSYCGGMVDNYTTDIIGSDPPQLHIITDDAGMATAIEDAWKLWSESLEVNLPSKLTVLNSAKTVEGEGFTLFYDDEEAGNVSGVRLNLSVISPRRVTDINSGFTGQTRVENGLLNDDGVFVSVKTGRPVKYQIMSNEDEANGSLYSLTDSTVNARFVTQWFMPKRPDQFRGVSEIQAALPLFAYLRRYTLATISSAEIIASMTAFLKTMNVPGEGPAAIEDWSEYPITKGMLKTLPDGWEPIVLDQKHPASTYEMFVNMLLREIGRVLNMPFGVMVGDSSRYNYSSARLDYRGYEDRLKSVRKQLDVRELNIIYREWLREYVVSEQAVRAKIDRNKIKHIWRYSTRPSIDPQKDANTEDVRLRNGTTTLQEVYADRGEDWYEAMEQRKKEMEKVEELGLSGAFDYMGVGMPDSTDIPDSQLPMAEEIPTDTAA